MRVTVIHWNRTEGQCRAAELSRAGFTAESFTPERGDLKALRDNPPDVIVIDLTRLPSQGSAVAAALRQWKATRGIPLVFAGGAADKVQRIRAALPDAAYSEWNGVAECCRHPRTPDPAAVRTPIPGAMDSYAGTPLTRKLRLHDCTSICLINAPDEFPEQLEVNRERIHTGPHRGCERVLLFVERLTDLEYFFPKAERSLAPSGGLWIMWPKKASGSRSDLSGDLVRKFGVNAGWVDYKICAVDRKWSGLLFARRKEGDPVDSTRAGRRQKRQGSGV